MLNEIRIQKKKYRQIMNKIIKRQLTFFGHTGRKKIVEKDTCTKLEVSSKWCSVVTEVCSRHGT